MHVGRQICLVCIMLTALAAPTSAAEYFVGKHGADTNDGLRRETAFATIQKGVDALKSGDTLTIMPGEYFENVRRDKLGGAEEDTLIRAAISGTVVLRGDVRAPALRKVEGCRFTWVADVDLPAEAQAVNELDTLTILERMPNASELEFEPGKFFHDATASKLYISTSDLKPAAEHHYTVSVIPTHGVYLRDARRVVIDGLAATGFYAAKEIHHRELTGRPVTFTTLNMNAAPLSYYVAPRRRRR